MFERLRDIFVLPQKKPEFLGHELLIAIETPIPWHKAPFRDWPCQGKQPTALRPIESDYEKGFTTQCSSCDTVFRWDHDRGWIQF